MAEIRLTLATLLRRIDVSLIDESQTLTPFTMVFTQPKENKFLVNVAKRAL